MPNKRTHKKEKKQMEYDAAPSGFVTLYNYKEPFMKFEQGHGFQGVLLFDGETDKIQCHLCGGWFGSLPHHIKAEHNFTAARYKDVVGLRQTTALISESMREKLIASGLDKRLQNLRRQGKKSKKTVEKIRATLKRNYAKMESKNELGTCPLQLIDRLQKLYFKLGRTPSEKTDKFGFKEALVKVYGSMENACKIANIPYRVPGQTIRHANLKYTKEFCVDFVRAFLEENSRLPRRKDDKAIWNGILRYGKKQIFANALTKGKYIKVSGFQYTNDQLLAFLRSFETIHGRPPSYSDCKRGLLPHLSRYTYNFGSWKKALELAFDSPTLIMEMKQKVGNT